MVSEAVDSAARNLLYKLYDATAGRPGAWQVLGNTEGRLETVARAVARGWIIIRDDRIGRINTFRYGAEVWDCWIGGCKWENVSLRSSSNRARWYARGWFH